MTDGVIGDVMDTAFWIAHYRAIETKRGDALFQDPLAGVLAGERGERIASAAPMGFWTQWSVVIRTVIIDDFLRWAVSDGVDLILNLGAGLDTRPYRMDLPGSLVWVEADYPRMIGFKEEKLRNEKPRCQLERVTVDLANVNERRSVLASIDRRATKLLVLTEGVIPYLSNDEVGALADDLHSCEHIRYWIVEYMSPESMKYRTRGPMRKHMQNAPFKFDPKDWFGFFQEHGWRSKEIRYLMDEGMRHKRMPQLPALMRILFAVRGVFSSLKTRERFRKFSGYVLLERAK